LEEEMRGEREGPITRYADRTTIALQSEDGVKRVLTVGANSCDGEEGVDWTSRSLWPSGAMLGAYLWQTPRPGKLRVLELACGAAALPGVALALGGHHVTFADLPEVLPLATRNVQLNADQWGVDLAGSTQLMGFNWQHEVPEGLGLNYDLVVGSDICYAEDHIEHIRRWLRTLLLCQRDGVGDPDLSVTPTAIIAGENRSGTLGKLMELLGGDGVDVARVPVLEPFARFGKPHGLELYHLTRGSASNGGGGGGGGGVGGGGGGGA
jgi:hypothetical protein